MDWSKTKEITETLKNICTLVLYLMICVFFIIIIWPKIKNFEVKEVSIAGMKMGPKEKQALKTIENVATNVPNEGKDTSKIAAKYVKAAKIIDKAINVNNQNWVYIGQIINGKLANTHFKINKVPNVGDVITANDAVYKRKDLPIELKNGDWKLGDIRGVVTDNESVKVTAIQEIRDSNFWALVQ